MAGINEILDWFKSGKKPTQTQFWATWQSFWHKEEKIPQASIDGLPVILNAKGDRLQFNAHVADPNAHGFEDRFALKEHGHVITEVSGLQEQVEEIGRLADEVIRLDENVQILKTANFSLENNMHKATIFCQGTGTINVTIPVLLRQDFICLLYNIGTGNVLPVLANTSVQSMITKDGAILLESNRHGIIEHFIGSEKFIVRENIANELCIKKDIYGNSKDFRPNTFIGGIAKLGGTGVNAPIRTAFELSQKLGINANRITSFRIVNDDVECNIKVFYGSQISFGGNGVGFANQNITHFIDAEGYVDSSNENMFRFCEKIKLIELTKLTYSNQCFRGCTNVDLETKIPLLTSGTFIFSQLSSAYNQSKLLGFPKLKDIQTFAFHNCLGFTEINMPQAERISGGSNFYGIRNVERYYLNNVVSIADSNIFSIGSQKCRLIEIKSCKNIAVTTLNLIYTQGLQVPHPTDFKVRINDAVKGHVCFTNLKTHCPWVIIETFDDLGNHISTL